MQTAISKRGRSIKLQVFFKGLTLMKLLFIYEITARWRAVISDSPEPGFVNKRCLRGHHPKQQASGSCNAAAALMPFQEKQTDQCKALPREQLRFLQLTHS